MAWWQSLSAASEGAEIGAARAAANVERAIRLRQAIANQQQRELDTQTVDTTNRFPGVGAVGLTTPIVSVAADGGGSAGYSDITTDGGTSSADPAVPVGVAPRGSFSYPNITGGGPIKTYSNPPPPKPTLGAIYMPEEQSVVGTPAQPAKPIGPLAQWPMSMPDYYPDQNWFGVDSSQSLFDQTQRRVGNYILDTPGNLMNLSANFIETPIQDALTALFGTAEQRAANDAQYAMIPAQPAAMMNLPGQGATFDQLQGLQAGATVTSDQELAGAAKAKFDEEMAAYNKATAPKTTDPRLTGIKPLKSVEEYSLDEQKLLAQRSAIAQQESQAVAELARRRQANTQDYQQQYTQLVQRADNARRAGNTQEAAALMGQANTLLTNYRASDQKLADGASAIRGAFQKAYDATDYKLYLQQVERGTSEIANKGDPSRLEQVLSAAEGREIQIVAREDGQAFMIVEFDRDGNPVPRMDADKNPKEFTADEISNTVRMRIDDEYRAQFETAQVEAAKSALDFQRELAKELALKAADRETEVAKATIQQDEYEEYTAPQPDGTERKYLRHKVDPSGHPIFLIKPGETLPGGIKTEDTLQVINNGAGATP